MTKLVYFQIVDGSQDEIKHLATELETIKEKLDMEFLIGNERVELHDVKYLLNELYALYKKMKQNEKDKTTKSKN
jgi:hypothetical protein